MAIEYREGKARPTLPRSSDLRAADPDAKPAATRDAQGRFLAGSTDGFGARWKHAIAEQLGRSLEGEAGRLGREAYKLYRALLRDMPVDNASVRVLVAARARAVTLAGFLARRAAEVGNETSEGERLLARAATWDARAERNAVTAWDLATKMASTHRRKVIDCAPWLEPAEDAP